MLRTARLLPLSQGFRHWASTRPVSRPGRQSATGPPGSYPDRTSTGKRRRADEPAVNPLHDQPPALLGTQWVWKNVKHDRLGRTSARNAEDLKTKALAALRRLQRTPHLIQGFFADPNLRYITT
jgi:hypothetical protein